MKEYVCTRRKRDKCTYEIRYYDFHFKLVRECTVGSKGKCTFRVPKLETT